MRFMVIKWSNYPRNRSHSPQKFPGTLSVIFPLHNSTFLCRIRACISFSVHVSVETKCFLVSLTQSLRFAKEARQKWIQPKERLGQLVTHLVLSKYHKSAVPARLWIWFYPFRSRGGGNRDMTRIRQYLQKGARYFIKSIRYAEDPFTGNVINGYMLLCHTCNVAFYLNVGL